MSETGQIKLLPCPFCGGETPQIKSNGIGDFYIACEGDEDMPHCGASSSDRSCETPEQAARRWNCRPADAELTRLQQSNAALVEREKTLVEALEAAQEALDECACNFKPAGHGGRTARQIVRNALKPTLASQ